MKFQRNIFTIRYVVVISINMCITIITITILEKEKKGHNW